MDIKDALRDRLSGDVDKIREGKRLRELRTQNADMDSPCARCGKDYCPSSCFPCRGQDRKRAAG